MSFQNEDNKLDWMYKSATSLVDREEYLLGRKIDKTLEILNAEEKQSELGITQPKNHVEHECIPPSIRDYNRIQIGEQQVDLATKLQEDPLVAIKKREEETRKQFLQNPIQLKKLQSTLDRQLKKTKKKSKKHKRKANIDSIIAEKLQALKDYSLDLSFFSRTDLSQEKNLDKILLKKFRKYKGYLTEDDLQEILESKKSTQLDESISRDSDNDDNVNYSKRHNSSEKRDAQYNRSQVKSEYQKTPYNRSGPTKRLTQEEKEKMRKEMMDNALWRDKERTNNVKRYREQEEKESKMSKDYNPDFLHKELMKSANSGSVESRIKSNINSIQRSKGDMNRHFSKRQ